MSVPAGKDGTSLVPFLSADPGAAASAKHPAVAVCQFHGENLIMSWYMVREGEMKYVVWGTGKEHDPQLFNLTADPDEETNLALTPGGAAEVTRLDALLRQHIDYPAVSIDVAQYNLDMAHWWVANDPDWRGILNGTCGKGNKNCKGPTAECPTCPDAPKPQAPELNADWGSQWQKHPDAFWKAWQEWFDGSARVVPCPSNLTYNWPSTP